MKGCRNCHHWQTKNIELDRVDPATANQKVQLGLCRRYAPRPSLGAPQPQDSGAATESSPWPHVASDDWCGEWEPSFS